MLSLWLCPRRTGVSLALDSGSKQNNKTHFSFGDHFDSVLGRLDWIDELTERTRIVLGHVVEGRDDSSCKRESE